MTPRPGTAVDSALCPIEFDQYSAVRYGGLPELAGSESDSDDGQPAAECRQPTKGIQCRDPPSSTSFTSFLQPGVILKGQQLFVPKSPSCHHHHSSTSSSTSSPLQDTTSRRDTVISAIERLISARTALEQSAAHLSPARHRTLEQEQDAERQELLARLRLRIERELSNSRSLLDRANATLPPLPHATLSKDEKRECWSVQVMIMSTDPNTHEITGLMHALGLSMPLGAQVTTYFTGTVISPSEGLWTRKYGARKKDDAEYWTRLGPFARRNVSKDELRDRGHDPNWLAEISRGWVLMRWKEREFVNVIPSDSTLSIAGYYLIALDRTNGSIEGLYYDPVSSPYQRLTLSVESDRSPFTLGTFELH